MIIENPHVDLQRNRAHEEKLSIINILTCFICSNKAELAHICPHCSKFYCEVCIKQWLLSTEKCCPNCRRDIAENGLVNCHKLSHDLSSALEALIKF